VAWYEYDQSVEKSSQKEKCSTKEHVNLAKLKKIVAFYMIVNSAKSMTEI